MYSARNKREDHRASFIANPLPLRSNLRLGTPHYSKAKVNGNGTLVLESEPQMTFIQYCKGIQKVAIQKFIVLYRLHFLIRLRSPHDQHTPHTP